ncbi:MAG: hypothetical protein ACJ76X_15185 [Solirubrobacteraceae bacterium]
MSSAPTQSTSVEEAPPSATAPPKPPTGRVSLRDGSWREWIVSADRERTCLIVLAVAMVAAIAFGLAQTRGATFSTDEYLYFVVNRGFHLKTLLSPHNGNFMVVIRFLYAAIFKAFGPDYLIFRILLFVEISVVAGLFYALVRRRIGAVAALAFTLPLLFLGSSADVAISTIGVQHVLSVILCLGALLALEADSRVGDIAACLLLTLAVATFSLAFAFIGAAAVAVLMREDRWRRIWIPAIPVAVYLLWLVAAPKYTGVGYLGDTHVSASNLLLIPSFFADAAVAVAAGVSGLSYDFVHTGPTAVLTNTSWGVPLALIAFVALVWRIRRGGLGRWFWPYLAIPVVFWLSVVVAIEPNRYPNSNRYIYGGAVALLLLAAEALRRTRWSPTVLVGLLAASVVALTGNIAQMRRDGSIVRNSGAQVRAVLTSIELARDHVASAFLPPKMPYEDLLITWGGGVKPYLRAVTRNGGSFAFTVPQLRQQTESVRTLADRTLIAALRIHLRPASAAQASAGAAACQPVSAGTTHMTVSPPGIAVRSNASGVVRLRRFAKHHSVNVGALRANRLAELPIPRDRSAAPWIVTLPRGVQTVCPA